MKDGSWIQDHPKVLERAYQFVERLFLRMDPLFRRVGYDRVERLMLPGEDFGKRIVFGCHSCGQCVLHYAGMTCPMTCPKNLRNGPCGGVRSDNHCEVKPEIKCVWVRAYERSQKMPIYGEEIMDVQPMHDWAHEETSAWVNMLRERHDEIQR